MVKLKTEKEINIMQEGGKKLRQVVNTLRPLIKPGITTEAIDKAATQLLIKAGGEPSFNKVGGYQWCSCLCVNEQVVHTPPSGRKLQAGDLFTIDIGMFYQGFHTDYSDSFVIGEASDPAVKHFLEVGKNALNKAIHQAKPGNYLGKISQAIETVIYGHGYFILKELTGHGVGRTLHEDPYIPGYLDRPVYKTMKLKPGMVIAIEVIYSMGSERIAYEPGNDWSLITADRSLSACFEHTVAINNKNGFILT